MYFDLCFISYYIYIIAKRSEKVADGKTDSSERRKSERDDSENVKFNSSKDRLKEIEMYAYENDEEAECEDNNEN